MPLRIGFDMDGVLADFSAAYHAIEERLYGPAAPPTRAGDPEDEAAAEAAAAGDTGRAADNTADTGHTDSVAADDADHTDTVATGNTGNAWNAGNAGNAGNTVNTGNEGNAGNTDHSARSADRREPGPAERRDRERRGDASRDRAGRRTLLRRHRDQVWQEIHSTVDFWTTLKETEAGAVRRVYELMLKHRWEVFFITQRPATAGDTVQRQTQRWLVEHGFDLPSVLVVPGSRGAAAGALTLDYHVDDSPKNCIDVKSESRARALLIVNPADDSAAASAHRLGIGTAQSIGAALDVLEQATIAHTQPTLLERLARMVGWT